MLPKNMKDRCRFDILEIVAWICALVALSPAILWLSRGLVQSGQLREAMIIMVSALLVLAVEYGVKPHRPRFSKSALAWLCGAYAMFFVRNLWAYGEHWQFWRLCLWLLWQRG